MPNPFVYVTSSLQLMQNPLAEDGPVYVDIETYGHQGGSALDVLTNHPRLAVITGQDGPVLVVDLMKVNVAEVVGRLENRTLVGHNMPFDLPILIRHGLPYPKVVRDTLQASQVLMAGVLDPGHDLKTCMSRYLNIDIVKEHGGDDWSVPDLTQEQLQYAADDAFHLRKLHPYLLERLAVYDLTRTYELECDLILPMVSMTLSGVRIDQEQWRARAVEAGVDAVALKAALTAQLPVPDAKPLRAVGLTKKGTPLVADVKYNAKTAAWNSTRAWNLGSPPQVKKVFGLIGVKLPDTSHKTLMDKRGEHPILDAFISFRKKDKEAGSFGLAWLDNIRPGTDRVYPQWRTMGARSGRMSCANPNLQQIPRGAARKGIIASEGKVLVRADFSQIEARIAAVVSGDETLTRLFVESKVNKSFDIHRFVASKVLGKDVSVITKDERQIGKSLLFGLLFGMQTDSLLVYCRTNYGVTMTFEEATEYRKHFFDVFPGLLAWHNKGRRECRRQTDFRTLSGRRRHVDIRENQVNRLGLHLNHPVQGTGADMLKMAIVELWRRGPVEFPAFSLVALIHDEIIGEVDEHLAEEGGAWLKKTMLEVGDALIDPIPTDAEVKIGRSWGG